MQVKNYFLHKVLNIAVLWSSDKHHPVVGKAFHCGFLSELGTMTEFEFYLNSPLPKKIMLGNCSNSRKTLNKPTHVFDRIWK